LSEEHQVLSIPTFKVFANGEAVDQKIGLIPAAELENLIQAGLSKLG
jgi:thioredoxin-like negative regulator of GroEL